MSCSRQPTNLPPAHVRDIPCSAREWRRRPRTLPKACNDNPPGAWVRSRALLATAVGGLIALAVTIVPVFLVVILLTAVGKERRGIAFGTGEASLIHAPGASSA